jgi:hypothetical protein
MYFIITLALMMAYIMLIKENLSQHKVLLSRADSLKVYKDSVRILNDRSHFENLEMEGE